MSSHRITEKTYASRNGALAVARRILNRGENHVEQNGIMRWWTMQDVVARRSAGRWSLYAVLDDAQEAKEMSSGTKQALAEAFYRQQAGLAELEARRADIAGLAGAGFKPGFKAY